MDFLDEGETPRFVDGVPQLKRISTDFMESAVLKSDYENVATATTVEDMTVEMQAFLAMRQMGMGEISYEQYLRTYGVKSVNMREGQRIAFLSALLVPAFQCARSDLRRSYWGVLLAFG